MNFTSPARSLPSLRTDKYNKIFCISEHSHTFLQIPSRHFFCASHPPATHTQDNVIQCVILHTRPIRKHLLRNWSILMMRFRAQYDYFRIFVERTLFYSLIHKQPYATHTTSALLGRTPDFGTVTQLLCRTDPETQTHTTASRHASSATCSPPGRSSASRPEARPASSGSWAQGAPQDQKGEKRGAQTSQGGPPQATPSSRGRTPRSPRPAPGTERQSMTRMRAGCARSKRHSPFRLQSSPSPSRFHYPNVT